MCTELEVDPDTVEVTADGDSVYSSGLESDSTSLITAARNHTFENGRRYHGYKEGQYIMPNDEQEQDRMDIYHHQMLLALKGELVTIPIKELRPQRILDIGTGTGIWAIDAGDSYPQAEVVGIDLSPIQPHWVPPNVKFEVDDVEDEWTWQENYFDYIHLRAMAGSIRDWPKLLKQAFRALRPGGYIEVQDIKDFFLSDDDSVPADSVMRRWIDLWSEGSTKLGTPWLDVGDIVKKELPELGYVGLTEMTRKLPVGPWPKDKDMKQLGLFCRMHYLEGAESICLAMFTRALGMKVDKVLEMTNELKKEFQTPKMHPHQLMYCIYARKPESG